MGYAVLFNPPLYKKPPYLYGVQLVKKPDVLVTRYLIANRRWL